MSATRIRTSLGLALLVVAAASCSNQSPTAALTASGPSTLAPVLSAPAPTSPSRSATATPGIQLIGNDIADAKGNRLVLRGPEHVVTGADQVKDIEQMAALGANAVRMLFVLDAVNQPTPEGFDALLGAAAARHMVVWVSLYTWDSASNNTIAGSLGGGQFHALEGPAGAPCSEETPASCYLALWSRQWLKDLMHKYRANVIVDAMQEFVQPGDPGTEAARATWAAAAKTNVEFFRAQGYANPLEVMANFEGRDLYGIVEHGDAIRSVDTVRIDGYPQTMFGWQAYWGTDDGFYPSYQGALLLGREGGVVTGPQAIHQFAATRDFPIQIGIDNYAGDTNLDYQAEIDQAAVDGMSWLWWSWQNGTVECPVSGNTCQAYVTTSQNGFRGAPPRPAECTMIRNGGRPCARARGCRGPFCGSPLTLGGTGCYHRATALALVHVEC